jgi:hypothetical protein
VKVSRPPEASGRRYVTAAPVQAAGQAAAGKPQPEAKAQATNEENVSWSALKAGEVVSTYERYGAPDMEGNLRDLLADLMHWSDVIGFDFDGALNRARRHHEIETQDLAEERAREGHPNKAPACEPPQLTQATGQAGTTEQHRETKGQAAVEASRQEVSEVSTTKKQLVLKNNCPEDIETGCEYAVLEVDEGLMEELRARVATTRAAWEADHAISEVRFLGGHHPEYYSYDLVSNFEFSENEQTQAFVDALENGDYVSLPETVNLESLEPGRVGCRETVVSFVGGEVRGEVDRLPQVQ